MKTDSLYEDLSVVFRRTKVTLIFVQLLFVFLAVFFWKMQILDHHKYWQRSEANRIREIILPPQRGLIKDRFGNLLAKNIASFKVSLIRENCRDLDVFIEEISPLIDITPEILQERINKYKSLPKFRPIVIKENLTEEEIARCETHITEHPELIIQAEAKRYYPRADFASHILGYLQEVSAEELRSKAFPGRHLGDMVGKTGIEKEYETQLAGTDGQLFEIVNSLGRKQGELKRQPSVPGEDLILSLDSELQEKAEEIINGKEGAVVILDPRNGEILAMASYPNFDPNKFINRFTPDEWRHIAENPGFPLQNRAIRGLYSPGSIFKPTMSIAGLELGLINEWTTVTCHGETIIYGHPFACWYKPGHGPVNLFSAIRYSCNIYYYHLGKRLGIENIARYARVLGFGRKTGIDLPGEKEGLVPDPEWKARIRKTPWYPGETISVSIGQGPINVTPVQVAFHTAIIANRGKKMVVPHLVRGKTYKEGVSLTIKKKNIERVIKGMWQSANMKGTARAAKVDGFDVCGKTGSTQLVGRETAEKLADRKIKIKTHSWFTGFAPRDNPRVVVTVIVEYGGMGGVAAAPIAGELFRLYKKKKAQYD